MPLIELILIIAIGGLTSWFLYSATQQRQMQMGMENAFYQLLKEQDSCISLIQLAANARVDPQMAQQYLECQVKMLNAVTEIDEDGNTYYRFPKLRLHPFSVKTPDD